MRARAPIPQRDIDEALDLDGIDVARPPVYLHRGFVVCLVANALLLAAITSALHLVWSTHWSTTTSPQSAGVSTGFSEPQAPPPFPSVSLPSLPPPGLPSWRPAHPAAQLRQPPTRPDSLCADRAWLVNLRALVPPQWCNQGTRVRNESDCQRAFIVTASDLTARCSYHAASGCVASRPLVSCASRVAMHHDTSLPAAPAPAPTSVPAPPVPPPGPPTPTGPTGAATPGATFLNATRPDAPLPDAPPPDGADASPDAVALRVAEFNRRFHISPAGLENWHNDGLLPAAGILLHCIDGWETGCDSLGCDGRWQPKRETAATSLISDDAYFPGAVIPIFNELGGLIFRPNRTRVACAKPADGRGATGGQCIGQTWQGASIPAMLRATTISQLASAPRPLYHNEFVIDGESWSANMPHAIDAFFRIRAGGRGVMDAAVAAAAGEEVARQHRRFLLYFGLKMADCPLLELDRFDWVRPFSLVHQRQGQQQSSLQTNE